MKKILIATIFIACIGFILGGCASSNITSSSGSMSINDRKEFSQNIRKIYIWTYISGDSRYYYHQDGLSALKSKLQNLGYETEEFWYNPEKASGSAANWKNSKISSLQSDEALIELITNNQSYEVSKTIPTETTKYVVRDSYGRPVGSVNEKGATTRTKTKGTSSAWVYLYYTSPTKGNIKHNYSYTVKKDDLPLAVNNAAFFFPKKG